MRRKAKLNAIVSADCWVELWKIRRTIAKSRGGETVPKAEAIELLLLHPQGWKLLRDSKDCKEPMPPKEGPSGNRNQPAARPTRYV